MTIRNTAMVLTDKALSGVLTGIESINAAIPFAYELTGSEKRALPKISSGTVYFVDDSLVSAKENPTFVPAYINLEEMERSLMLYKQLSRILTALRQLVDLVESTLLGTGSQAYTASLSYYQNVKQAAKSGVPGAQAIYEKLRGRFEQSGASAVVTPAAAAPIVPQA